MRLDRFVLITLFACGSPLPEVHVVEVVPPPNKQVDGDGLGTPIGDACAKWRFLGCPEGTRSRAGRTCYQTQTEAASHAPVGPDAGKIDIFPAACFKDATSPEEERACGSPSTIRVRCIASDAGTR